MCVLAFPVRASRLGARGYSAGVLMPGSLPHVDVGRVLSSRHGKQLEGCDRNLQLVLSTQAANGVATELKVEAIHCW
jgi:hypothetical protein